MRILALLAALIMLNGCGFQLRGVSPSPIELSPIALKSNAEELNRLLVDGIERIGGIVDNTADIQLHILSEQVNRHAATVDSTAKVAEFTLIYEVEFQLRYANGAPASDVRNIQLRRTYQFDNTRIVGKFEEENLLMWQLRQQTSTQILAQLARIKRANLTPNTATTP
jgi:LPS-assembly lipoprotein